MARVRAASRTRPCVPEPVKLPCVQDREPLQLRRRLFPITLFSPHAVPSTAASSLEWHVFPTVHHSVLQTLCRKHSCTGHGYCTGQPSSTNLTCRERITLYKAPHPERAPQSHTRPRSVGGDPGLRPCHRRRWSRRRTAAGTGGPRRRGRPGALRGSPAPPGQGGHPGTAPSPG